MDRSQMVDNRSLERKLLALSKGEKVEFTAEEQSQIGYMAELNTDEPMQDALNEKADISSE